MITRSGSCWTWQAESTLVDGSSPGSDGKGGAGVKVLPAPTLPLATVHRLLRLLEEGGGSTQIADPPDRVHAAWRSRPHQARLEGQLPEAAICCTAAGTAVT